VSLSLYSHRTNKALMSTTKAELPSSSAPVQYISRKVSRSAKPIYWAEALYPVQGNAHNQLTLREGELIGVIQERGEWVLAKTADNYGGFVPASFLRKYLNSKDDRPISRRRAESLLPARQLGGTCFDLRAIPSYCSSLLLCCRPGQPHCCGWISVRLSGSGYYLSDFSRSFALSLVELLIRTRNCLV